MIWLNPIWMNREVVFIGGRRCHHMPTLVVKEKFHFFPLSLIDPSRFHQVGPLPIRSGPQILCGLLQDIGALLPYGLRVEKGDIFLPSDVIVVKRRQ